MYLGQSFGHGRFPNAGLPHEDRVVFAPAAEHLDGALQFKFAADEGIQFSLRGPFNQIGGKALQRIGTFSFFPPCCTACGGISGPIWSWQFLETPWEI